MMYHISSLLHGEQTVRPETKPNLQYKETWVKLAQENHRAFCTMYASENISQEIEARLGWRKASCFASAYLNSVGSRLITIAYIRGYNRFIYQQLLKRLRISKNIPIELAQFSR